MKKTTYVINSQFTQRMATKIIGLHDIDEIVLTKNCIDSTTYDRLWYFKRNIRIHKPNIKFKLTSINKDWAVKKLLDSDNITLIH